MATINQLSYCFIGVFSLASVVITDSVLAACDPPHDVGGCARADISFLVDENSSLPNSPFIAKLPNGNYLALKPLEHPNNRLSPNSTCNPPDDISGCIVVPGSAQAIEQAYHLTDPYVLKPSNGIAFQAIPLSQASIVSIVSRNSGSPKTPPTD
jgi:hypothetical protein